MSQVTMYSTTWCGYCRRLKLQLDAAGVAYDEVNIERDPEAAAFVENVNGGNRTVPTVRFPDGSALTNPSMAQVDRQAGRARGVAVAMAAPGTDAPFSFRSCTPRTMCTGQPRRARADAMCTGVPQPTAAHASSIARAIETAPGSASRALARPVARRKGMPQLRRGSPTSPPRSRPRAGRNGASTSARA